MKLESCTFALFGALGDLALRKLFPALYQLDRAGLLHDDTRILALAREAGDPQRYLGSIDQALRLYVPAKELEEGALARFQARLHYLTMDFLQADDYLALTEVAGHDQLIAYFATPASVYGGICANLAAVGLAERCRVVLEKPIGHDLARKAGVNLDKARPRTRRMWEARGLAVIALARGDLAEAQKIMAPFARKRP